MREAIDEVARELPIEPFAADSRGTNGTISPRTGRPRPAMRGRAWALAAAVMLGALAVGVFVAGRSHDRTGAAPIPADTGIEFVELEIRGHAVTSRVIDARSAGSILVLPDSSAAPGRRARPVAMIGGRP